MSALDAIPQVTDLVPAKHGDWRIERFTVTPPEATLHNVRCLVSGAGSRVIEPGTYTKLIYHDPTTGEDRVIMSDTPAERRDHLEAVKQARGWVLVTGLGLGMVVRAMLLKPEVEGVVVIEKSESVYELMKGPTKRWAESLPGGSDRLAIMRGDALTTSIRRGYCLHAHFDTAWHDIWPDIAADNVREMARIRRVWRAAMKPDAWVGCWAEDECKRLRREERRLARLALKADAIRHDMPSEIRALIAQVLS